MNVDGQKAGWNVREGGWLLSTVTLAMHNGGGCVAARFQDEAIGRVRL
jgi:predicted GNAT superfamily acetyltransferase